MTSAKVAVDVFQLRFSLKSQNDRIVALSVLGNSGVELRQALQAGKLVQHKPHRILLFGAARS